MICSHYGKQSNLIALRQQFNLSARGTTLAGMTQMAEQLGLASRCLSLGLHELSALKAPCILHWDVRKLGDIQSRFGSLNTLRETFTSSIVGALIDGTMVIGVIVMMVLYGGWLTGVVIGFTALYVLTRLMQYLSRIIGRNSHQRCPHPVLFYGNVVGYRDR